MTENKFFSRQLVLVNHTSFEVIVFLSILTYHQFDFDEKKG
jgi:hypothetical protein